MVTGPLRADPSRPDDLRRSNLRAVIALLRQRGPMSRTDIARECGLSPATVSTLVGTLIDHGIVIPRESESGPEGDDRSARRGRPQVVLALAPGAGMVATVALSLNAANIALWTYDGEELIGRAVPIATENGTPQSITTDIARCLEALLAETGIARGKLDHVAVGVQGVTDVGRRAMIWAPITQEPIEFADALERHFGVPVTVANDCEMIATAISSERDERLGQDFLVVTLSRGIGMGVVRRGIVVSGVTSSAMEFGHMVFRHGGARCRCGQTGCIEAYAGDYAIWRHVNGMDEDELPHGNVSREEYDRMLARALGGPGKDREAFKLAGQALGVGLRSVFALLDRMPVAFVGFGAAAHPVLEAEIRRIADESNLPSNTSDLVFQWRTAARPLISRGCALTALDAIDDRIAAGEGRVAAE